MGGGTTYTSVVDVKSPEIGEPTTEVVGLDQEFPLFDPRFTKREDWGANHRFYSSDVVLKTDALPDIPFDVATILNFTNKGNNIEPLSDPDNKMRGFLDPRLVLYGDVPVDKVDPVILKRLRVQITFPNSSFVSAAPFWNEGERTLVFGHFNPSEGNFRFPPNYGLILPQKPEEALDIKGKFVLAEPQK